ncbi:LysR family transcriptional regulator [Bordetella bronchialis]|uniref:LysR family transcriptional regulator n=1 Tax=Bordetella bronchialis TaxID=463025 RepID=A0A193G1V5_9BORD|nr:LysR family transcriptional regulator [Bordetella bronchialis]ANN68119.1 LysR family transcriptional regulator [Bordetella bronchialis]ANN73209.1 LysR family transcriptional regulator [Bordetella bronchialis]
METFPELRDLQIFCTVVRLGSFARCAAELGASSSYVSKRMAILERVLGCSLLHRTTRQAVLTDDGQAILRWALSMLDAAHEMQGAVSAVRTEPRGTVRISASFRLGRRLLTPALSELSLRYPFLDFSLVVVDRPVDLIAESIDLDIRIGAVPEPHLIAHRLAGSRRILCASPAYIARRGMPAEPQDLREHACLAFRERDQPLGTWRLQRGGDMHTVKVHGPLSSNNNDIIWQWALAGHGIIRASEWDCAESLASGEMVRVLAGYDWPADVWAVTTHRQASSAKVRVCLQFLKDRFASGPFAR